MTTEPIYLCAPYEDKPWFYVEQNPKTHPGAMPYYRGSVVAELQEQLEEQERKIQRLEDKISNLEHQHDRLSDRVHQM